MRLYRLWMFMIVLLCLLCTAAAYAQATTPDPAATAAQAITLLTPVIVPILVWAAKKVISNIPSVLLPIIATALGVAVTQVGAVIAGGHYGLIAGALLGLGGVGLREVLDQVKKTIGPGQ